MTVITLSRELGSHGNEIAVRVAQELGLRLIDAETINRAAQQAGVPRTALAELEQEGERSLANQVLKALRTMPGLGSAAPFSKSRASEENAAAPGLSTVTFPFVGLFSPTVPPLSASLEVYVRMVGLVIRGLAHEDNVLLLGRGGQVLLKDHPGALHIQTVAPVAHRVQVLMTRYALSNRDAQHRVRASDRARFDYLRRYHDVNWLDPILYHLVINTACIPVATAVQLIIETQHAISQAASRDDVDAQ